VVGTLEPEGHLVVVHHRAQSESGQSGDSVHQAFSARDDLLRLASHHEPDFLLDVFTPSTPP
jgi:hypothetical protein